MKNSFIPKLLLVLAIAYTALLAYFSLKDLSGSNLPNFKNADKVYHATAYFGLTTVWSLFYYAKNRKRGFQKKIVFLICLFAISFGILLEVLQGALTSYRTDDPFDALANSTGVILALGVVWWVGKKLLKVKNEL